MEERDKVSFSYPKKEMHIFHIITEISFAQSRQINNQKIDVIVSESMMLLKLSYKLKL